MEISALLIGLILSQLNIALKQNAGPTEDRTDAGVSSEASSVKCRLQGTTRLPAFSMDGDYVIGGVFSIHHYLHTVMHNYTIMPESPRCTGR